MMNMSFNFNRVLSPGERLVWVGKQKKTHLNPIPKILMIVLPIVSIFALTLLVHYYSYFFIAIALPLAILEAFLIEKVQFDGFKEEYAVSNKRLFIKGRKSLQTRNIIEIKEITMNKTTDKTGTLIFEPISLMESIILMENSPINNTKNDRFSFLGIKDYVNVYGLINKTRDNAKNSK